MTYADGEFLHHYLTIKNTMTEAIRSDPETSSRLCVSSTRCWCTPVHASRF